MEPPAASNQSSARVGVRLFKWSEESFSQPWLSEVACGVGRLVLQSNSPILIIPGPLKVRCGAAEVLGRLDLAT
jgi:hypothetical protein